MAKNKIIVGLQWGDEGKGKVVDLLAAEADIIARFQGGANAGHTIIVGETKYVLHLIPSGIIHADKQCIIGNGVVIDPHAFKEELEFLKLKGIDYSGRLWVSSSANLVMPYHILADGVEESERGSGSLGTTKRGIGPAYIDKVARRGIRVADLFAPERLKERLQFNCSLLRKQLGVAADAGLDADIIYEQVLQLADIFEPLVVDASLKLAEARQADKAILFEGAQGCMLDIDVGTYPFATSSNTTVGGALTGLGIGPSMIDEVVGIVKAYATRVGTGPFPTEQENDIGQRLRTNGDEFGATTGRPRRCGWLDLVALRHAVRVNGVDSLAITKLDVLDGFDEIKVAVAYELDGQRLAEVPLDMCDLDRVKPVFKSFPGWSVDTTGMTGFDSLPIEAREYLSFIADDLGARISLISTGARRRDTIMV